MRTEADRTQTFSRRAMLVASLQGGFGLLLAARMGWLSIFEEDRYALLAEENRVSIRLIPPRRGQILDRYGEPLALNRPDYRLALVPEQIDDLDATLAAISAILPMSAEEIADIKKQVGRQPRFIPVEIRRDMDWATFAALNVRLPELPGLQPIQGLSRFYPDGAAVGHILGYVGSPTEEMVKAERDPVLMLPGFKVGKDGLEKMLDSEVRGIAGAARVEVNAHGRVIRDLETTPDTPGADIITTIDRDLQTFAAERVAQESASVVVMDVVSGDVLALLSMPAFDPNAFSDGISHKEWNSLLADERHPIINKPLQGLYPPGSTFKMAVALAGLEAGVKPEEGTVCTGRYPLGSHVFHCWKRGGHGRVNMRSGIYQSCDTYFYDLGRKIGVDAIARTARKLGLGERFDIPMPTQKAGIVPDQAWKLETYGQKWLLGETLNASIGQGYMLSTPLQLAVMTSRLASGLEVTPRLIRDDIAPLPRPLDIDQEHLDFVRQAMSDVVNSGAGTAARARLGVDGILMAGKTGTAQVRRITMAERRTGVLSNEQLPWRFRDHALFVAYAPIDSPRYAIAVVVEHGGGGSAVAAPIARDVMTHLFKREQARRGMVATANRAPTSGVGG